MLAKRIDPVEDYKRRAGAASTIYQHNLKRRKLSVHARFVAAAFDVFPGASIVENTPVAELSKEEGAQS